MSDVDPLIKREMQWMALGVLENRDLAPIIIAKVRRQRIRRALVAVLGEHHLRALAELDHHRRR
jgi:hypothetical protein